MIFNSVTFLLFLSAFCLLYWTLPKTPRQGLIFAGSIIFYSFWRYEYVLVMMFSISIDYLAALAIARHSVPGKRLALLFVSLSTNLLLLGYFKYANFLLGNMSGLSEALGFGAIRSDYDILLPLGISFYTFQSISYTVDVYRGLIAPQRNFLHFANFVLFFPQLVAGPILRGAEIIEQLKTRPPFNVAFLTDGLRLILAGLFLKTVLADNLAGLVDDGFSIPAASLGAKDVWALAFLFGFQIYFDFAGYSQIAIGAARLMGVHFPANFDFPYLASSPRGFWKRWHISLSSWIRDYLYLPFVGAKVRDDSHGGLAEATEGHGEQTGGSRRAFALFATWIIMGLWHGAAWTFALWGLWHALLIAGYRALAAFQPPLPRRVTAIAGWLVTFPLVMLGWIPFRAKTMDDALTMMATALSPAQWAVSFVLPRHDFMVAAALPILMLAAWWVRTRLMPWISLRPGMGFVLELPGLTAMVFLVFVFLRPIRQFIYFQF